MSGYKFEKTTPDQLVNLDRSIPFFFTPDFVLRLGAHGLVSYVLTSEKNIVAFIHFSIQGNHAVSLPKSTYNGLLVLKAIEPIELSKFVGWFLNDLMNAGVEAIEIKCPPTYFQYVDVVDQALRQNRFNVLHSDITQVIAVNEESFAVKLNRNRKRALSKSATFEFLKLDTDNLEQVHGLLAANRQNQGYPMTMSFPELKAAFDQFPDHYILFGVFDKKVLIAASIMVKVNQKILYDFYHGELLEYREKSPVTRLLSGLYEYAFNNGFTHLDLGISTDKGELNKGLYHFKISCGTRDYHKITYFIEQ